MDIDPPRRECRVSHRCPCLPPQLEEERRVVRVVPKEVERIEEDVVGPDDRRLRERRRRQVRRKTPEVSAHTSRDQQRTLLQVLRS